MIQLTMEPRNHGPPLLSPVVAYGCELTATGRRKVGTLYAPATAPTQARDCPEDGEVDYH